MGGRQQHIQTISRSCASMSVNTSQSKYEPVADAAAEAMRGWHKSTENTDNELWAHNMHAHQSHAWTKKHFIILHPLRKILQINGPDAETHLACKCWLLLPREGSLEISSLIHPVKHKKTELQKTWTRGTMNSENEQWNSEIVNSGTVNSETMNCEQPAPAKLNSQIQKWFLVHPSVQKNSVPCWDVLSNADDLNLTNMVNILAFYLEHILPSYLSSIFWYKYNIYICTLGILSVKQNLITSLNILNGVCPGNQTLFVYGTCPVYLQKETLHLCYTSHHIKTWHTLWYCFASWWYILTCHLTAILLLGAGSPGS